MTAPTTERADWGALLFLILIALLGFLVAALCLCILWQFRDAFMPVGALAGGVWYGLRLFTPRRQP